MGAYATAAMDRFTVFDGVGIAYTLVEFVTGVAVAS
jgi:hypothetical protein